MFTRDIEALFPQPHFGTQALGLLHGESVAECVECALFEKCHKITVAAYLHGLSDDLELIVQNGLTDGSLKAYMELGGIAEARLAEKEGRSAPGEGDAEGCAHPL